MSNRLTCLCLILFLISLSLAHSQRVLETNSTSSDSNNSTSNPANETSNATTDNVSNASNSSTNNASNASNATTNDTSNNNTNNSGSTTNTSNSTTSNTNSTTSNTTTNTSDTTTNTSNTTSNVCNNPFLYSSANPDGIPGLSAAKQLANNLTFCHSLQNKLACCNETIINALGSYYQKLKSQITEIVKSKDKNITESIKAMQKLVKNMKKMYKIQKKLNETMSKKAKNTKFDPSAFNTSDLDHLFNKTLRVLASSTSSFSSASSYSSSSSSSMNFPSHFKTYYSRTKELNISLNDSSSPEEIQSQMDRLVDNIKSNYIKFQKARKFCFEHLLKGFTKFLCVGCSTNLTQYFDAKVGKIFLHRGYCSTTMLNCFDYLSLNELFSGFQNSAPLVNTANLSDSFVDLTEDMEGSLEKFIDNPDPENTKKFFESTAKIQALTKQMDDSNTKANYTVGTVPLACANTSSCQYICDNFISVHGVDVAELLNPGIPQSTNARLLETASVGVVYGDNGFDISAVVSGVETQVSFSEDPAGTDSEVNGNGSSFRAKQTLSLFSLLICVILAFILS